MLGASSRPIHVAALSLVATLGCTQSYAEVKPFSSLCIEDQAVGFNWEGGKWVTARFKSGSKYLVQKFSPQEVESKRAICLQKKVDEVGPMKIVSACYQIKDFGAAEESIIFGEMCKEAFDGDRLLWVKCENMSFMPDGPFIKLPWHRNLSTNPPNDYKDSLVLSEGKCSRVN